MKINEKILERVNNIQDQIKNVQNLDMSNLVDLKRAQESLRVIKNDFNNMLKESPLYAKVMELVTKFMNYDVTADIEKWENIISEKIDELNKKANKTPECAGCTCNCEECDPDKFDDEGETEVLIKHNPLTGEELLEEYLDEDLSDESKSKETFANLVAEYINTYHDYLDRVDDDDQIDFMSNILFEFINFTMSR